MRGRLPDGLEREIRAFLIAAGLPFDPWKKSDYTYRDGQRIATETGEALDQIGQHLLAVSSWRTLKRGGLDYCDDWTEQDAENAIREAAKELPVLCDRVEGLVIPEKRTKPMSNAPAAGDSDSGLTANERMRQAVDDDPRRIQWTANDWAEFLGCSVPHVYRGLPMWDEIRGMKKEEKRRRAKQIKEI